MKKQYIILLIASICFLFGSVINIINSVVYVAPWIIVTSYVVFAVSLVLDVLFIVSACKNKK